VTTYRQITTVVTTMIGALTLQREGERVSIVMEAPAEHVSVTIGELDDLLAPLGYQRQHTVIKYEGAEREAPPSAAAGVEPPAAARSPILDRIAGQVIGPEEALQQLRGAQRSYPQTRRPDAPAD
jgi:hypothetical protein